MRGLIAAAQLKRIETGGRRCLRFFYAFFEGVRIFWRCQREFHQDRTLPRVEIIVRNHPDYRPAILLRNGQPLHIVDQ